MAKFIRTSTDLQRTSIENQDEILDRWIKDNNHIIYNTYIDEGISGTKKSKRIQWLRMLEDAKDKAYDILLCKSYSRFGRNQIETLSAIKILRENGIRIVFLEDGLDSDIDNSRFGLMAWLAEEESKRTSKRIKEVQQHFKEVGKVFNCVPPYGYIYDKEIKNFVINKEEAKVVKRIFKLYLLGNGTNKIANILSEENIKTKKGGLWRGSTIKNIIINEVYLGTLVQGKSTSIDVTIAKRRQASSIEWFKHYNNHEPIIDQETFVKANNIFNQNSRKSKDIRYSIKGISRASNTSLFSNLLKCSCGSSMTIRRKSNRKPFYNCTEYERIGLKVGHQSNFIQEEILIEDIKDILNELIENNFDNLEIANRNNVEIALKAELEIIEKQIKKQIQLSNDLVTLYTNGMLQIQQFQLQNESIGKALNKFIANKEAIEEKIRNLSKNNTSDFKKSINDIVKLPVEQWNNMMLKEVIDYITININGTINIKWIIEK
ncbi:recombinase family protein [Clostridium perfringens]|uniref:recombinase family protein n=1 Tax=Clostridium perfringens TaxID=1502 RepID=UPI002FCD4015